MVDIATAETRERLRAIRAQITRLAQQLELLKREEERLLAELPRWDGFPVEDFEDQ